MNIREHDCVVLTADLAEDGLQKGDVGTVVHILRVLRGDDCGWQMALLWLSIPRAMRLSSRPT